MEPFDLFHDATVPDHALRCTKGLLLLRYLQWELRARNLSRKEPVRALERIRGALVRTSDGKAELVLEPNGAPEARIGKALNLERFIPGERDQSPRNRSTGGYRGPVEKGSSPTEFRRGSEIRFPRRSGGTDAAEGVGMDGGALSARADEVMEGHGAAGRGEDAKATGATSPGRHEPGEGRRQL